MDNIVKIGSFSYHVKKKEITGYTKTNPNASETTLRPELTSRWISPDPLAEEFPGWSPYTFTFNNPIYFTDILGLAPGENEAIKFSDNDGSRGLASTYVDKTGKIIKHLDDNDPNIYLVDNVTNWDDTNKGLNVIGTEQKGKKYEVGEYLEMDDLFSSSFETLPRGFILQYKTKIQEFEVSPLLGGIKGGIKYILYWARGSKAAKGVSTVDDLIAAGTKMKNIKAGGQISVKGNIDDVFNSLSKGGKIKNLDGGRVQATLSDGTILTKYPAGSGSPTIQVNQGGKLTKVRFE